MDPQQQWDPPASRTGVVQQLVEALGEQQVPQPVHLRLQLPDQFGVGIFVDDGVAADLFGAVRIPAGGSDMTRWSDAFTEGHRTSCRHASLC